MSETTDIRRTIDLLVRRERGRLVAGLVRRLGGQHLQLAEDVAQEALLAAMASWPFKGLPEKPAAWLATVARNRAIDRLRRETRETELPDEPGDAAGEESSTLFEARIEDPELRLIFLCCHDSLGEMDRLALTLKLVSGFTAREIGQAFLARESAVAQRLVRAKRRLRALGPGIDEAPSRFGIADRVPTALKVVYLMFGLGYAPRSGDRLVRRDVAMEALRLARELAGNTITATPDAKALAALLCLQASRFDAREDPSGRLVLLREQDRGRWDKSLIDEGLGWLTASREATVLSRYHVEAGIAAIHATAPGWGACDWTAIVGLYRTLEQMTGSPIVSVSACVAQAMAGDPAGAIDRLERLGRSKAVSGYAPYYVARAEVNRMLSRIDAATADYRMAMDCESSAPVLRHLEGRLASCVQ